MTLDTQTTKRACSACDSLVGGLRFCCSNTACSICLACVKERYLSAERNGLDSPICERCHKPFLFTEDDLEVLVWLRSRLKASSVSTPQKSARAVASSRGTPSAYSLRNHGGMNGVNGSRGTGSPASLSKIPSSRGHTAQSDSSCTTRTYANATPRDVDKTQVAFGARISRTQSALSRIPSLPAHGRSKSAHNLATYPSSPASTHTGPPSVVHSVTASFTVTADSSTNKLTSDSRVNHTHGAIPHASPVSARTAFSSSPAKPNKSFTSPVSRLPSPPPTSRPNQPTTPVTYCQLPRNDTVPVTKANTPGSASSVKKALPLTATRISVRAGHNVNLQSTQESPSNGPPLVATPLTVIPNGGLHHPSPTSATSATSVASHGLSTTSALTTDRLSRSNLDRAHSPVQSQTVALTAQRFSNFPSLANTASHTATKVSPTRIEPAMLSVAEKIERLEHVAFADTRDTGSFSLPDSLGKRVSTRANSVNSLLREDSSCKDLGGASEWQVAADAATDVEDRAVNDDDDDDDDEDDCGSVDLQRRLASESAASEFSKVSDHVSTSSFRGAIMVPMPPPQAGWASLPAVCLQGIAEHLPLGAQLLARLVCQGWRRGVYMSGMVRELPAAACLPDMHVMDMLSGRQQLLLRIPTAQVQLFVKATTPGHPPLAVAVEQSGEAVAASRTIVRTLSARSTQLAAAAAAAPAPDIRVDLLGATSTLQLLCSLRMEAAGMFEPLDPMLDVLSSLTSLTSLSLSMKLSGSYNFVTNSRGRSDGRHPSEHMVDSTERAMASLHPILAVPNLKEFALVVHVGVLNDTADMSAWHTWATASARVLLGDMGSSLSRVMVCLDEPGERVLPRALVTDAGKDWGVGGAVSALGGDKSFLLLSKQDASYHDEEPGAFDAEVVVLRPVGGTEAAVVLDALLQAGMDAQPPCHMRLTHLAVALTNSLDVVQVCDQAALLDLQRLSLGVPVDMDWLNILAMQQDLPSLNLLSNMLLYTTPAGSAQQAQSMWELQNVDHVYLPTMCTTLSTLAALRQLSVRCGLSTSSRSSYATSLLQLTGLVHLELVNDKRRFSCNMATAWLPPALKSLVVEQVNLYHPLQVPTAGSVQEWEEKPVLTQLEELTLRTTTILVSNEQRLATFSGLRSAVLDNVFIHLPNEPSPGAAGGRSTRAAAAPLSLPMISAAWPQLATLDYRMSSHRAARCSLESLTQMTKLSWLAVMVPSHMMEWHTLPHLGQLQCLTHLGLCAGLDCGVEVFESLTSLAHLKELRLEGKDIREQLMQQLSQHLGPKPMWWLKQKLGPRTDLVWV